MLGVLSRDGIESWVAELKQQMTRYKEIKLASLPDVNSVQMDPLSGASNEGWDQYYKVLRNFITLISTYVKKPGFGDCVLYQGRS